MGLIDQAKILPKTSPLRDALPSEKNSVHKIGNPAPSPGSILASAHRLHPDAPAVKSLACSSTGSRKMCDAATALTFLKTRHCQEVADRVAIVANLCNYDVRLNTDMIAKYCPSLRIALWALSIMNNDLSLLVPDAFCAPQIELTDGELNMPHVIFLYNSSLIFRFL